MVPWINDGEHLQCNCEKRLCHVRSPFVLERPARSAGVRIRRGTVRRLSPTHTVPKPAVPCEVSPSPEDPSTRALECICRLQSVGCAKSITSCIHCIQVSFLTHCSPFPPVLCCCIPIFYVHCFDVSKSIYT